MKLTLKNVKVNKAMSEETHCFSATIYKDGKKVGTVCNRGHGGHLPRHRSSSMGTTVAASQILEIS